MHIRHEQTFEWLRTHVSRAARLYGPYHHGGRSYYQWSARGQVPARPRSSPSCERHRGLLDAYTADRFDTMCERYRIDRSGPGADRRRRAAERARLQSGAMLAPSAHTWRLLAAAPPREVFAVDGADDRHARRTATRSSGDSEARIVEHRRRGLFGNWAQAEGAHRWVRVPCGRGHRGHLGRGRSELGRRPDRQGDGQGRSRPDQPGAAGRPPAHARVPATRGPSTATAASHRARSRSSPPGRACPIASSPSPATTRPEGVRSSPPPRSRRSQSAKVQFVKVRVAGGDEGWVETDQIVPSPAVSTREAQIETARFT